MIVRYRTPTYNSAGRARLNALEQSYEKLRSPDTDGQTLIEQLADELSELFGRRVDLVSLRSLHPLLQRSVLAEARPVYAA
jgi:hypothetical protein